jgi:hypothetical protein
VRFTLVTVWLAAPWRLAAMGVLWLSAGLAGRRQPGWLIALLAAVVVTIAVVQAVGRGEWSTVVILTALVVAGVGAPLADAAVSRASERAADRYAAAVGVGFGLAYALHAVDRGRGRRAGVVRRALSRHPPVEQRVEVLLAATAASLQPLPATRTPKLVSKATAAAHRRAAAAGRASTRAADTPVRAGRPTARAEPTLRRGRPRRPRRRLGRARRRRPPRVRSLSSALSCPATAAM